MFKGDEPLINPNDIKKIIKAKKKFPNHVICGFDNIHPYENPFSLNLPKVVVNQKNDLVYMSRSAIPGSKKILKNRNFLSRFVFMLLIKNN